MGGAEKTFYVQEKQFISIDDLLMQIREVAGDWDAVWYRGCTSPSHQLLPKVKRSKNFNENILSIEFKRRMRSDFSSINEDIDWLVCMQHFGVPTRLLDWTESLIVALYFACLPLKLGIAPTIWILDPYKLTNAAIGQNIIPVIDHPHIRKLSELAYDDDVKNASKFPLPLIPNYIFPRLKSQDSCFTVHGLLDSALEIQVEDAKIRDCIYKFSCEPSFAPNLILSMEMLCRSHMIFFPDMEGFSRIVGPDNLV